MPTKSVAAHFSLLFQSLKKRGLEGPPPQQLLLSSNHRRAGSTQRGMNIYVYVNIARHSSARALLYIVATLAVPGICFFACNIDKESVPLLRVRAKLRPKFSKIYKLLSQLL